MVQPSAPTQHCIFLPPYAAANFSSSPSTPPTVPLRRSRCRVAAVARRHSAPVRPTASSRHPSVATADPVRPDVGACYRAASLGVSLWPCKIFIVDVCPRSFSGLASPLAMSMAWTVDSGDVGLQEPAVACSHVCWQWLREQFRSNSYHLLSIYYFII